MDKPADTDLPLHPLIARRYSPRAFDPRPVDEASIELLLEAARWAASCFNEQPWTFIVASEAEPEEHAALAACLLGNNAAWASAAPLLLLCVAAERFAKNQRPNAHAWHDVGLAVGNLSLQATALGLGVHVMAGIDRERARETYAIPEGQAIISAIAVGYPGAPESLPDELAARERAPRTRKPAEELFFSGRWGQARAR